MPEGWEKVARWAKLKLSQMVKLSNKAQPDREGDMEIAQPEREGDGATVGEKDSEVKVVTDGKVEVVADGEVE